MFYMMPDKMFFSVTFMIVMAFITSNYSMNICFCENSFSVLLE